MIARRQFTWNVALADPTGQTRSVELKNYWDPQKDFITPEVIYQTAAAEVMVATKQPFIGVMAELVE